MRGLLVSSKIDEAVCVSDNALPVVFEKGLELRYVLQDDGGHDVSGAHGGLESGVAVRQGHIGKLVEHETHGDGQRPLVDLVCLKVQLLERLGIKHTNEKVQAVVVAVRDDAENGLFAVAQLAQFHGVPGGDVLDLREGEGGKADGSTNKDAFGSLARGLFENTVLPQGDVVWLFLFQRLKEQIQWRFVVVVFLFGGTVFDHGQYHFHGLLLYGCFVEKIQHKGAVQSYLGFLPKGVVGVCSFWGGVLDEVVYEPEHIRVLADVVERVIAVGTDRVNEVKDPDGVAVLEQQGSGGSQ